MDYINCCYIHTVIVNMKGGAPSPVHECVDTWHNKYVKKITKTKNDKWG